MGQLTARIPSADAPPEIILIREGISNVEMLP
jgi:hypothetical protein